MMKEQVEKVITDEILPSLALHGGGIELVGIEKGRIVKVRLTGACNTCPGRQQTTEQLVEATLKKALPAVEKVVLQNQVDTELIRQALQIIRQNK